MSDKSRKNLQDRSTVSYSYSNALNRKFKHFFLKISAIIIQEEILFIYLFICMFVFT